MNLRVDITRDIAACQRIRRRVFIEEQGVDPAIELDGMDEGAVHFLAMRDGQPVGTARITFDEARAKIGRVAVLPEARGQGLARELMLAALAYLDERPEIGETILAAQAHAHDMYRKFEFIPYAEQTIANIPHIWMRRTSQSSADVERVQGAQAR